MPKRLTGRNQEVGSQVGKLDGLPARMKPCRREDEA
jgi:hypothetical protein